MRIAGNYFKRRMAGGDGNMSAEEKSAGRKDMKKNNLRIAMLGHKRIPSREGGIEVVVEELATRRAARGCSVTC